MHPKRTTTKRKIKALQEEYAVMTKKKHLDSGYVITQLAEKFYLTEQSVVKYIRIDAKELVEQPTLFDQL